MKFTLKSSHIYVINLERRKDRLDNIEKEMKKHSLEYEIFKAADGLFMEVPKDSKKINEINAQYILGCMVSHWGVVEDAWKNRYPFIIVLEDDIILCEDFIERIKIIEGYKLDFDILYIGGHFDDLNISLENTEHKYIKRVNSVSGTYGYIINSSIYEDILNNCNYNYGIDEFYSKKIQTKNNCYAFIPFLVDHQKGYSDIAETTIDYGKTHRFYKKKM